MLNIICSLWNKNIETLNIKLDMLTDTAVLKFWYVCFVQTCVQAYILGWLSPIHLVIAPYNITHTHTKIHNITDRNKHKSTAAT